MAAWQSQQLISLFECPVCFEYVMPPILQCEAGHCICNRCRPRLTECPTCRGPLGNCRNLSMEKVAELIRFPCKYAVSGCKAELIQSKKSAHEDICEARPYDCPLSGELKCTWNGSLSQIMTHIMTSHSLTRTLQGESVIFMATEVALNGPIDWTMIQSCYGRHFLLVLKKKEKNGNTNFKFCVQLVGSAALAAKYYYNLELQKNGQYLTWGRNTAAIHDGVSSKVKIKWLKFDRTLAEQFVNDDGNLAINIRIKYIH